MTLYYSGRVLIHKIPMGAYGNNGYVVIDPVSNQSVVIDTPGEPEKLVAIAMATEVKAIVITHTHFDHLVGFEAIRSALDAPVAVDQSEAANLPLDPDFFLADGDAIEIGEQRLEILNTPGHTTGSSCFRIGEHLFSGDTLFPGGPGRTRTPADFRQIVDTIKTKLLVLPKGTTVYPGHGDTTTISDVGREFAVFTSKSHPIDLHGDVRWEDS